MLLSRWDRTRTDWDDAARDEIQRTYLEPLRQQVAAALSAMARVNEAISQTRQQCQ